ncbi:unnamed protein product [Prunus armeniaca]
MVRGRDASSNVGGRVQLMIQSYYVMLYQGGMDLKCPNVSPHLHPSSITAHLYVGLNLGRPFIACPNLAAYNAGATMNAKATIAEYDISRDAYVARFHEEKSTKMRLSLCIPCMPCMTKRANHHLVGGLFVPAA